MPRPSWSTEQDSEAERGWRFPRLGAGEFVVDPNWDAQRDSRAAGQRAGTPKTQPSVRPAPPGEAPGPVVLVVPG